MKLKNLFTAAFALLAFAFTSEAQIQPIETPMFGNVRFENPDLVHKFGVISGKVETYLFRIKNETDIDMQIIDINIAEKIGVTLHQLEIKPKSDGYMTITVDPTILGVGGFSAKIIVTTKQSKLGTETTRVLTYKIEGEIK